MKRIDGHVALVTGGGRGIGAAVALRLAEEGADVVLTYESNEARAADVVERIKGAGRRALAVRADSGDAGAVVAAVEETAAAFGRLDILVNNAAAFPVGALDDFTADDVDRTLAINVRGPFLASQAAARHMRDGGRIIHIGSNISQRTVFPGFALYSLSKTALIGLTKGMARDLGPRAITVNLVHPGATNTELNPADGPNAESINAFTALGHFAEPSDIAATVAHLAGPDGRYVTGTEISVDGGFSA